MVLFRKKNKKKPKMKINPTDINTCDDLKNILVVGTVRGVANYPMYDKDCRFKMYDKCMDMSHNPPTHLYIPNGASYRHRCPSCGNEQIIRAHDIRMRR